MTQDVIQELISLYMRTIKIDRFDIDANYNLGLLHLKFIKDYHHAIKHFKLCTQKDQDEAIEM